jgi:hypothetical protein
VLRWAMSANCPCAVDTWCAAVRCGKQRKDYRPLALLHSSKRPWSEAFIWLQGGARVAAAARLPRLTSPSPAVDVAGAGAGAERL